MHTPFQRFAVWNMGFRAGSAAVARVWHLHRTQLAHNELRARYANVGSGCGEVADGNPPFPLLLPRQWWKVSGGRSRPRPRRHPSIAAATSTERGDTSAGLDDAGDEQDGRETGDVR